jgi:pimeloyl-ACP methyl ester carboxylesterase
MGMMSREKHAIPAQFLVATALVFTAGCFTACQPPEPSVESAEPVSGMAAVNDVELYYEIHGEGTALILMHGGLGHSGHWKNQLPALSEHYKVITVDSRGHGRSTMTEQQISFALMASDIVALMDYLEIERAHILGWSDGGNIGLYLAIHHPERLIKVVASGANYNPSGVRSDVGENQKFLSYIGDAIEDYQTLSPDPANWDAFFGNIGQMWASEPDFTVEQLGSIAVPVLLLDGESDEAIYTGHTIEMAGLIPTAKLTFIAGTGHFGMWEKPVEINTAILDFLAR